jgi:hypothetical protein
MRIPRIFCGTQKKIKREIFDKTHKHLIMHQANKNFCQFCILTNTIIDIEIYSRIQPRIKWGMRDEVNDLL